MAYLPKSKYQIKYTTEGSHVYSSTLLPYNGPYINTSNGDYVGSDPLNLGPKLKTRTINVEERHNLGAQTILSTHYNAQKPKIANYLDRTLPIVSTKTIPTEKDYQIGFYTRYFAKRVNCDTCYYEIDKNTYKALSKKKKTHDGNLYIADTIRWALVGEVPKSGVNTPGILNTKTLLRMSKEYFYLYKIFPNSNEFMKLYYTKGNLFKTTSGKSYIGYYHTYGNKFYKGKTQTQQMKNDLDKYELFPFFKKRALIETIVLEDDSEGQLFTHDYDPSRGVTTDNPNY